LSPQKLGELVPENCGDSKFTYRLRFWWSFHRKTIPAIPTKWFRIPTESPQNVQTLFGIPTKTLRFG
jgi:hypothetical protein